MKLQSHGYGFLPRFVPFLVFIAATTPRFVKAFDQPESQKTEPPIEKVDRPVTPELQSQVFLLKYLAAEEARGTIRSFFPDGRPGLDPRVNVVAEPRTNSLLVRACPSDMADVKKLIVNIDINPRPMFCGMRVFKLRNSLAKELAPLLQNAFLARMQQKAERQGKSPLVFIDVDPKAGKILKPGIMADVVVLADPRNNTLCVRTSAENEELIAAIIKQLDGLPVAEAQIKVFSIVNADAAKLTNKLQGLFDKALPQGGGEDGLQLQFQFQRPSSAGELQLVSPQFSVEPRTNSIIAAGTASDLQAVQDALLRLDEGDR